MNVGLYLMNRKGLAVLEAACSTGVEISHAVTAPAAGMKDDSDQRISAVCKARGIPVFVRAAPPMFMADVTIAAGWRWLLDVENLVVLHDSLLPRYRGFAPLVTALINGEPEIGVTAFLAAKDQPPDTGPIVAQRSIPVAYPARVGAVIDRLLPLYTDLATAICDGVRAGEPLRYAAQDERLATHSLWRDELDYRIDWGRDDRRICRLVDAVSDPFPGAWTELAGEQVRVLAATTAPDIRIEDRQPGKIFALRGGSRCVVVCGTGMVEILALTDPQGQPRTLTRLKERFA